MKFPLGAPNLLTSFRLILIPVLVLVFYLPPVEWRYPAAAVVFLLAAVTDYLDGLLARHLEQTTPFGAFLDPVADKLVVAVALVLLVEAYASAILAIPALVIVGREIVVSALREWMAHFSEMRGLAVSLLGKVKTVLQMMAITLLLWAGPGPSSAQMLGYGLLYTAALLTIWSMWQYLKLAWPELSSGMKGRDGK